MFMSNEEIIKKRVAREILSMIETVCFSEEFREYRVNNGSNGTRNLIIENIKKTYSVGWNLRFKKEGAIYENMCYWS